MNFNFPLILLSATVICGVITLIDSISGAHKKRKASGGSVPWTIDYARSLFPVFLIVFFVRSFLFQPYVVPTGSLKPTVMPIEFLFVNQYDYGVYWPVWHKLIFPVGTPQRGQIALFHWPVNPEVNFIKRVIGVPGDHISYINKVLYINGKEMSQKFLGYATDSDSNSGAGPTWKMKVMQENLDGLKHDIYVCADSSQCPSQGVQNFYNLVIPKGEYLMMGDNRDNSDDGRDWGLVPANDFIGEAKRIIMSWDSQHHRVRWHRIGTAL